MVVMALLLIGGAVVNIAVAWGCVPLSSRLTTVFWGESPGHEPTGNVRTVPAFVRSIHASHPEIAALGPESRSGGYTFGYSHWMIRTGPWDHHRHTEAITAGWPAPTFAGMHCTYLDSRSAHLGIMHDENELVGIRQTASGKVIPVRPIPSGFVINTLFYTLILWLLFVAPFTARRIIRRRRGMCEKCAYPIGVSTVCTECGAAVARKAPA